MLSASASRLTSKCLRQATQLRRGVASSKQSIRSASSFLDEYDAHVQERAAMANGFGIAPKPLDAGQANRVISEMKEDTSNEKLKDLIVHRVPPGVDEAAYVKATWLSALATNKESHPLISQGQAI